MSVEFNFGFCIEIKVKKKLAVAVQFINSINIFSSDPEIHFSRSRTVYTDGASKCRVLIFIFLFRKPNLYSVRKQKVKFKSSLHFSGTQARKKRWSKDEMKMQSERKRRRRWRRWWKASEEWRRKNKFQVEDARNELLFSYGWILRTSHQLYYSHNYIRLRISWRCWWEHIHDSASSSIFKIRCHSFDILHVLARRWLRYLFIQFQRVGSFSFSLEKQYNVHILTMREAKIFYFLLISLLLLELLPFSTVNSHQRKNVEFVSSHSFNHAFSSLGSESNSGNIWNCFGSPCTRASTIKQTRRRAVESMWRFLWRRSTVRAHDFDSLVMPDE